MDEAEATVKARQAFGNVSSAKEAFYEKGHWLLFDFLFRDLRHAMRLMKRGPGFTAVIVLTLAVGIGANTAIFSLVDAVLLRPLPYKEPGRLTMLWTDDSAHNDPEGLVSLLNFADWKAQNHSFEDMTLFGGQTFLLGTDGSPERLRSARVPANFFPLVGVKPILGRVFSTQEEQQAERVAVLSYGLWQRRFGGLRQAVGSDLVMDGRKSRVIGVMPRQFQFPFQDTQVWEPITTHPYWAARDRNSPRSRNVWYPLGRLKSGVSLPQAQAEMNAIARRLEKEHPENAGADRINVVPLPTQTTGKVRRPIAVLFGSVFMVLLIACINVANLLLARGTVREREFAVRRSLGAGRLRLAGQLLTESLVLAMVGGLLGLVLANAGLKALITFGPQDIPRLGEARLNLEVLLFALAVSVLAAIISGVWPAIQNGSQLARSRQWTTLANRSTRSLLMIGEFSLALMLLTGAGLLVRSFLRLGSVNPGFQPANLLTMRIDLHVGRTGAQHVAYFREAIERAQRLPGIESAAGIGRFLKSYGAEPVTVEGDSRVTRQAFTAAQDIVIGPFFRTAGIPLRTGRFFSEDDRAGTTPVAIINETMARNLWPNEDPIGKRFRFSDDQSEPWLTVVGVAGDMHRDGLEKQVAPQVFRPLSQNPDNELDILVRTTSDPMKTADAVRAEIQSIDKNVAKFGVTTVEKRLGQETAERRFHTSLIGLFSLISLLLAAVGIYGLMQHLVIQRTHEIGVRVALGARYTGVMRLVLGQGLTLAGIGTATGLIGAFSLTRMLSSLLFNVSDTDPVTFIVAPAILVSVAALACWLPARRAARIDPMVALRQD